MEGIVTDWGASCWETGSWEVHVQSKMHWCFPSVTSPYCSVCFLSVAQMDGHGWTSVCPALSCVHTYFHIIFRNESPSRATLSELKPSIPKVYMMLILIIYSLLLCRYFCRSSGCQFCSDTGICYDCVFNMLSIKPQKVGNKEPRQCTVRCIGAS